MSLRQVDVVLILLTISLTAFRQQMRFGKLLKYLFLNRLSEWQSFISWCFFVQNHHENQKFNSCVTDGSTDGRTEWRTDQRTHIPSYRDARTLLRIIRCNDACDCRFLVSQTLHLTADVLCIKKCRCLDSRIDQQVEQSSDNRCVLADCPHTCLWIVFWMA